MALSENYYIIYRSWLVHFFFTNIIKSTIFLADIRPTFCIIPPIENLKKGPCAQPYRTHVVIHEVYGEERGVLGGCEWVVEKG